MAALLPVWSLLDGQVPVWRLSPQKRKQRGGAGFGSGSGAASGLTRRLMQRVLRSAAMVDSVLHGRFDAAAPVATPAAQSRQSAPTDPLAPLVLLGPGGGYVDAVIGCWTGTWAGVSGLMSTAWRVAGFGPVSASTRAGAAAGIIASRPRQASPASGTAGAAIANL